MTSPVCTVHCVLCVVGGGSTSYFPYIRTVHDMHYYTFLHPLLLFTTYNVYIHCCCLPYSMYNVYIKFSSLLVYT